MSTHDIWKELRMENIFCLICNHNVGEYDPEERREQMKWREHPDTQDSRYGWYADNLLDQVCQQCEEYAARIEGNKRVIYIVTGEDYEYFNVTAAFSSLEKARNYIRGWAGEGGPRIYQVSLDEFENLRWCRCWFVRGHLLTNEVVPDPDRCQVRLIEPTQCIVTTGTWKDMGKQGPPRHKRPLQPVIEVWSPVSIEHAAEVCRQEMAVWHSRQVAEGVH